MSIPPLLTQAVDQDYPRMSACRPRFAVCYIDKFNDPMQSQWTSSAISQLLKLQPQHRVQLSSGDPVVVKSSIPILQASQLKQRISKLGGCSWIQQLSQDGKLLDRRQSERRIGLERRALCRTSNLSDRRRRQDVRISGH